MAVDLLGDADVPTVLDAESGGFVEQVIALGPDLVIGTCSDMSTKQYELFSAVAPTIARAEQYADYGEPGQESTRTIGVAVGQPAAAETLITDVDAAIAMARAEHPEFEGKQAVCLTPYEALFAYGQEDPRGRILADLGFTLPEALLDGAGDEFGFSLSIERTSDLAGPDCVVWLDYQAAPPGGMVDLVESTDTFSEGRYGGINDDNGPCYVAQSLVTPLSIPDALERYVPQLAAALDGDPGTEPPLVED